MIDNLSALSFSLSKLRKVSTFFVFLLGLSFPFYFIIPSWYKVMPVFMLLLGIFVHVTRSVKIDMRLFLLLLTFFLVPLSGDLINIIFTEVSSWSSVEKSLRNLLLIYPVVIAYAVGRELSVFFYFCLVGLLIATSIACVAQWLGIYATESSHFNGLRTGLWWNPIPFSNAIVFMLSACLAVFTVIFKANKIKRWVAYLTIIIAILAALCSIILSGTRGSLLGFIVLLLAFLIVLLFSLDFSIRYRFILCTLFLIFNFFIIYVMQDRLTLAIVEAIDHFHTGPSPSSISIRLSAWSFSIQAFIESPWLGLGVSAAQDYKMMLIEKGTLPAYLLGFHAHSDLFDALQRSGALGVLGLFFLYMSPLIIATFLKLRFAELLPLFFVTCAAFLVGLTDTPLRNNISSNAFYLSYFIVLLICLKNISIKEPES